MLFSVQRETTENITLFADDTALYHFSDNSADVVTHLQHTGRHGQYMDKWKINLNKQKPCSSQIGTPGNFQEPT